MWSLLPERWVVEWWRGSAVELDAHRIDALPARDQRSRERNGRMDFQSFHRVFLFMYNRVLRIYNGTHNTIAHKWANLKRRHALKPATWACRFGSCFCSRLLHHIRSCDHRNLVPMRTRARLLHHIRSCDHRNLVPMRTRATAAVPTAMARGAMSRRCECRIGLSAATCPNAASLCAAGSTRPTRSGGSAMSSIEPVRSARAFSTSGSQRRAVTASHRWTTSQRDASALSPADTKESI